MKLKDFKMGMEFTIEPNLKFLVTDIGSRVVVAIRIDQDDVRNYNGPPYSVVELVFDEYDMPACAPLRGRGLGFGLGDGSEVDRHDAAPRAIAQQKNHE